MARQWARLTFGDGDTLDLSEPVDEWQREYFEAEWRAVSVKVGWLRSPLGRLDRALDVIVSDVVDSTP